MTPYIIYGALVIFAALTFLIGRMSSARREGREAGRIEVMLTNIEREIKEIKAALNRTQSSTHDELRRLEDRIEDRLTNHIKEHHTGGTK